MVKRNYKASKISWNAFALSEVAGRMEEAGIKCQNQAKSYSTGRYSRKQKNKVEGKLFLGSCVHVFISDETENSRSLYHNPYGSNYSIVIYSRPIRVLGYPACI